MFKKINFQIFLLFAIKMAILSAFCRKKGLGPLGVKVNEPIAYTNESKPIVKNCYGGVHSSS